MKKNQKALFAAVLFTLSCGGIFSQNVKEIHADEQNEVTEIPVCINEICAKNTTIAHEDGNFYDWVELFNRSGETVDLSGFGLSEKPKKPFKYVFPEGTFIGPGERLVVWCDKDKGASDSSTASFSLSADGETVVLTSPDSVTADSVTYGSISADVSYGRITDGGDSFSFMIPSQGSENKRDNVIISGPEFSLESGFYSSETEVEIFCDEGYEIFYTTDGSVPDAGSLRYTGPLKISDISSSPNTISAETSVTVNEYYPPDYEVDKAVIIRAVCIDEAGNSGSMSAASYFIGFDGKAGYYSDMKVISLITDRSSLFDYETGIYTTGVTYDNWLAGDKYDPEREDFRIPANYRNEGSEWEREAVIQIFEDGKLQVSENMGIRLHGQSTRVYPQKSFNVYARGKYGSTKLKYDLFGGKNTKEINNSIIDSYDSFVLRNGGNDNASVRFRDKLIQSLASERGPLVQAMEPCILFINGEYWGMYEIMEHLSEEYVSSHYDIDEEDVCLIKNNEYKSGPEKGLEDYKEFYRYLAETDDDFSSDQIYDRLCAKVDMQNYTEYICTNLFFGNYDWGNNNVALWKSACTDTDNRFSDERWRFIVFDTEASIGLYNSPYTLADRDPFVKLKNPDSFVSLLYRAAVQNEKFRDQMRLTFTEMMNHDFSDQRISELSEKLYEQYREPVVDTFRRFYTVKIKNPVSKYDKEMDMVRNFFSLRKGYFIKFLAEELGISPDHAEITVENNDRCGNIIIDGNHICSDSGSWKGRFYTDRPVHFSADTFAEHQFLYYRLSGGERIYDADTYISISDGMTVKVVYDEEYEAETVILRQPEDIFSTDGENAVISVIADGDGLEYQWYWRKNGDSAWSKSTFDGCTSECMTIPVLMRRNRYEYMCVLTDRYGKTTESEYAVLNAAPKPEITVQPEDISVKEGGMAEISVTASGTELSYQWQFKTKLSDWKNCSESTEGYNCPELKVAAEMKRDGYLYRCIVKNAAGYEVVSSSVKLGVFIPSHAEITAEPQNVLVPAGSTAKMRIGVQGDVAGYQWYWRKNSTGQWAESTFEGNDTSVMSVPAELKRNGYQYRCCITLEDGSVIESAAAVLGIIPAENSEENSEENTIIVSQPSSAVVSAGETAVYKVTAASETAEYIWQWKKPGKSWSDCTEKTEGYNTSELKVYAEEKRNGYQYRCIVTDTGTGKTYTSDTVLLLVK